MQNPPASIREPRGNMRTYQQHIPQNPALKMNSADPSFLTVDPFSNEFDFQQFNPMHASPLEDFDDGEASVSGSPFGTPGIQQYYSLSVPVRGQFDPRAQLPGSVTSHTSSFSSFPPQGSVDESRQ